MRLRARTDRNHAEVVAALRKIGCSVLDLSRVGKGCPDLLVGYHGRNYLLEVKDGRRPPSARKLTTDESDFLGSWRGGADIVISVQGAIDLVLWRDTHGG